MTTNKCMPPLSCLCPICRRRCRRCRPFLHRHVMSCHSLDDPIRPRRGWYVSILWMRDWERHIAWAMPPQPSLLMPPTQRRRRCKKGRPSPLRPSREILRLAVVSSRLDKKHTQINHDDDVTLQVTGRECDGALDGYGAVVRCDIEERTRSRRRSWCWTCVCAM